MTETDRIRQIYDARAVRYDRTLGVVERYVVSSLRREFGALLRGETLEVAIGSGLNLPFYTPAVTQATGVDLSAAMLEVAEERAAALGRPITLRQADAERLPFPDAAFDTVAISLALCTIPNAERALHELARVCRGGGRIVLLEHVRSTTGPIALLQQMLSPLNERAIGCHLDRETFALAESMGFAVEMVRSRLFGAVRLAVASPPARCRATLAIR